MAEVGICGSRGERRTPHGHDLTRELRPGRPGSWLLVSPRGGRGAALDGRGAHGGAAAPQGVHPRPAQASAPSATAGPSAAAFVWEKEQGRPSCSSLTSGCESTSPARVPAGMQPVAGPGAHLHQPSGRGAGRARSPPPPSDLGPGEGVLALPSAPPRREGPGEGESLAWPPPSPGGSGPLSLRPGLVTGGSDPEDMTLSLNTDVSDPRPRANGENVAATGKNEVAPDLVCPSPLRTADHWGRHSEPVRPSR